jgi:N-acetylornithine carbamoyltransferase
MTEFMSNAFAEFNGRSFLSTGHYSTEALHGLINLAIAQKRRVKPIFPILSGKAAGLLFFDASLRTRVSMNVAIHQLGGFPMTLNVGEGMWKLEHREGVVMDGAASEHIKEAIPVLSSYVDVLGVRCFPERQNFAHDSTEPMLSKICELSKVPVINLESAMGHPCQALADMMTIKEIFGKIQGKKILLSWANHPKALPLAVPNSFALAAAQMGANLVIASPEEYQLESSFMADLQTRALGAGGKVTICNDQNAGFEDAHIVYAKSWSSIAHYGDDTAEAKLRKKYQSWQVTDEKMRLTADGKFMHCLPVRRNVVVADSVLDGPASVVVQEAENRLHAQRALLSLMMGQSQHFG